MEKKNHVLTIKNYIAKHSVIAYVLIGTAMLFLVMLLTAQLKTVSETTEIIQGKRESELKDDLALLQKKYNSLKEENNKNQQTLDEYQSNSADNSSIIKSMQQEMERLSLYAGTQDVVGEGIVIVLTDGNKPLDPEMRQDSLVHDSDVLTVVNELKAAGAEAISVNGQRIISTTAIRCVGPTIQINYQKVAAPFIIHAIGNSQYLESAINIKNGVGDLLREIGVGVKVTREKNINIPKYDGQLTFKNAQIVK